jgi:alcohol dehydrogenase
MTPTMPFLFELPTRIRFGQGAAAHLSDHLRDLGVRKPMVVTDRGLQEAGILEPILERLRGEGFRLEIYDRVEANPKDRDVDRGAGMMRRNDCDGLAAIGGGSPIDCAKAMAVVAARGGSVRDYAGPGRIPGATPPIVALPTTAGTGSEVTYSAVITDTDQAFKFTVKGAEIAPRAAILDPELTCSMSPALTASTGMDALTHAIEAYTATCAHPLSDGAALHGAELIAGHLETAVRDGGNMAARSGMLLGSLLAGIGFSRSDVGGVHCLAEALGGTYDLPHGVCNAVMLPAVMEYNRNHCPVRYSRIATSLGVGREEVMEGAERAVTAVARLASRVGLPPFSSFGIRAEDVPEIARKAARNGSNASNPRPMAASDYEVILRTLLAAP